ncbi:site-specific integrase [Microbacterium aerolatum]|uniref:tyrosine-type recombinase/integrase n=1 Tax=Microbacterium aerolatum TaxID=153731 RepID=UPI002001B7CF|nr:site-specific integrase [Microbacterium aerolatum]MCK3768550.1 site-specific integrase [Microbacterium aerolatum]
MSIKQRPDGKYRARYRDPDGKEHSKHFELARDAKEWLALETASISLGSWVNPRAGKITWAEWSTEWVERQSWAKGTREAALTALESVPWGASAVRSVKASQVQAWVRAEDKRGLAASTIKTRLNYVQMCFRAAKIDKIISDSPAVGVKPPRQRKREVTLKVLSAEQVASALNAAGAFEPFVAVCVFAGLRLGEAAGLQLGDVNFLKRTIRVERQVQGSTIGSTEIVPPKAGSERDVFIPDELAKVLSAHVAKEGLARADDHLFRTPLGRLYNRNSAGEEWRRIRTEAKLPADLTLHSLRHTFASNLIASGCDVVTVQRALGHSQPSITLNVYSHLWPSAEDKTRTATADFMGEVQESADYMRTETKKPQVSGGLYR